MRGAMHRIAFLVALISIAMLAVAGPASATVPVLPLPAVSAFDQETEEEEEASEEEELEACEEEAEECEEAAEPGAKRSDGPAECPLRSASARASNKNDKLKLKIRYTTSKPVTATIEIRNGSTRIGSFKRHLGRSGVLSFTKALGEKRIGERTVIRIELPSGGAGCPSRRLVLLPK